MAKVIKFTVVAQQGKLWARIQPPCGNPDEVPMSDVLRWALEQINFEQWGYTVDEKGCLESLTIGFQEARDAEGLTAEDVAERVRVRLRAVDYSGVFARARERGTNLENQELAETIRLSATEATYRNTELYYAFELLKVLGSIRRSTFVFNTPPISGVADPAVVELMREATRAYLFSQMRSCVSLCRALVEAALQSKVSKEEIADERRTTRLDKGTLECLIDIAAAKEILSAEYASRAHDICRLGNWVLHRRAAPAAEKVWGVLLDTRTVVEKVYAG